MFAVGVVFLELLTGTRAGTRDGGDAWTANSLFDEVDDTGGSVECLVARADAACAWPRAAADALTALAVTCIHTRSARRPADVKAVTARLCEIRAIIDAARPPLETYPSCLCDVPDTQILRCSGSPTGAAHIICNVCLQGLVKLSCDSNASFSENNGYVPCAEKVSGCRATWPLADLIDRLETPTHKAYIRAAMAFVDAPRRKRVHDDDILVREEAARATANALQEGVRLQRALLIDADLTLRCPRCALPFAEYSGCNALKCEDAVGAVQGGCGAGFCGLCLADCGTNAHDHYYKVHGPNIFDRSKYKRVRGFAQNAPLQRALVCDLEKADLVGFSVTGEEILRAADVGATEDPERVKRDGALASLKRPSIDAREVVSVMREFMGDAVVFAATALLFRLTTNPAGKLAAVDAGAPAAVVAAMNVHSRVTNVAECGCRALCNLTFVSAGRQAALDASAPAAIVVALSTHKGVATLCSSVAGRCITLLLFLLVSRKLSLPRSRCHRRSHAAQKGVSDVACYGCWALCSIAVFSAGKQAAIDARAPAATVAAMAVHKDFAVVAEQGCKALRNIALSPAGRQAAVDARAPPPSSQP